MCNTVTNISTSSVPALTLKQIAAWNLDCLPQETGGIKASVPALQRGLVWDSQQIELLWDSILRGFPIGSLVICQPHKDQEKSRKPDTITHHLLDGQQRCYAITLGFHDPFSVQAEEIKGDSSHSILWLDIAPGNLIPSDSTRQFLTRVTTSPHPWGYGPDDNARPLRASEVRDALGLEKTPNIVQERSSKRPAPKGLYPWKANAPIPMAWLMLELTTANKPIREEPEFWEAVQARLREASGKLKWCQRTSEEISNPESAVGRTRIYRALCAAAQARIVLLEAPSDILAESRQEQDSRSDMGTENISSIEHLFQRLNRQGTPLAGEELAYSMIKAYWPKVTDVVEEIKTCRVPASRLVSLGVRAALTQPEDKGLRGPVSISALRRIAAAPVGSAKDDTISKQHAQISDFFFVKNPSFRLVEASNKVEEWLSLDLEKKNHGLPPVLVSSIARESDETYLLLLYFSDRCKRNPAMEDPEWTSVLPGLVTLLKWFSNDRGKVVNKIFAECHEGICLTKIRSALEASIKEAWMCPVLHPEEVDKYLTFSELDIEKWQWDTRTEDPAIQQNREKRWHPFRGRVAWNREMLLYAQRQYLARRFKDYDPANKSLWAGHNRPWDYDHLHPHTYFYHQQGKYAAFCRQWGNCIGNFRAWPFELNRSDQALSLKDKLAGGDANLCKDSFVDGDEIAGFSQKEVAMNDKMAAKDFAKATRSRLLRIYSEWYEKSGVDKLLPPHPK